MSYFDMEQVKEVADGHHGPSDGLKYYLIKKSTGERTKIKADAFLMRTQFNSDRLRETFPILKTFVPAAIALYLEIEKESWSKEIRMLTIMFLNLKVDLSQTKSPEGMERIQTIVKTVQRSIYRTRGALNKFLMDDKGSIMLICWGLPPLSSPDDPIRSVLSAMTLVEELKKINCGAYMGITTGTCFAGVCGTIGNRREYSLLGEVVNLSARYMGQAMYYSKQHKLDHLIFLDEKTKDLIQNKIRCEYVCEGNLKGFSGMYNFYEPQSNDKFCPTSVDPFPFIRTHRNNSISSKLPPNDHSDPEKFLQKSLSIIGQNKNIKICLEILINICIRPSKQFIYITGVIGSGKSLFIRRLLYEFLNHKKSLKSIALEATNSFQLKKSTNLTNTKPPFILFSFQSPTTIHNSFNGFNPIFQDIYYSLIRFCPTLGEKYFTFSEDKKYEFDMIGKIITNKKVFRYLRYIEEILETDMSMHYRCSDKEKERIFNLPHRDHFFDFRKFDDGQCELGVRKFFKKLLKIYTQFLKDYYKDINFPLILVTEDSQFFDDISINFLNFLRETKANGKLSTCCFIVSYQSPLHPVMSSPSDKMSKFLIETGYNPISEEYTAVMKPILDKNKLQDFIKSYLADKIHDDYKSSIDRIDSVIINVLMAKSFNGIPLFILDLVDNLMNSKKFVQILSGELIVTSELMDMEEMRDWSNFIVPMRMEKILGNVIDSLTAKDIILLKYASVIGNIFDIDKLEKYNPFNNLASDELSIMFKNLEQKGVIEILNDLSSKEIVCKFAIPFLRDILYQRMLIEQKNELHLNMARSLQYTQFKYMPHNQEVKFLELHLKTTEKTLTSQMEDESENEYAKMILAQKKKSELNLNNLKIYLVKDICERLKNIDLKIDTEEDHPNANELNFHSAANKKSQNLISIKAGLIDKKSDSGYTWESRFVVATNTKMLYYYHEKEYQENRMPLATIFLKHLFSVEVLHDYQVGGRSNLFSIQVSSWTKKTDVKGNRKFFFSVKTREDLLHWVITLNFLRVKANYDEFSSQFGLINLPLKHEQKKIKKKFKEKFKGRTVESDMKSNMNNSMSVYNTHARKSIMAVRRASKTEFGKLSVNLSRNGSFLGYSGQPNEVDLKEKLEKIKRNMMNLFNTFVIILANMQETSLNPSSLNSGDKVINIPEFIRYAFPDSDEEDDDSEESLKDNSQSSEKKAEKHNSLTSSIKNLTADPPEKIKLEPVNKDAPKIKVFFSDNNSNHMPNTNNTNTKQVTNENDFLNRTDDGEESVSSFNNNFAEIVRRPVEKPTPLANDKANTHKLNLPENNHNNVFTLENDSDNHSHATFNTHKQHDTKSIKHIEYNVLETFANKVSDNEVLSARNMKAELSTSSVVKENLTVKPPEEVKKSQSKFVNIRSSNLFDMSEITGKVSPNEETDFDYTLINKLKSLDVSANESEKELYDIISRMEKKNETEGKKIVDQTFENSAGFEFKETRTRNNSNVPRYTDPKYDFLKKEKYDEIYKNVYKTTLFKSILKK